jgi:hypothetical protein
MYMHPTTFLWLNELDRERAMTQKALERAARGGEPEDGSARGGINLARALDKARAAAATLHFGGPRSATPLTGPTGA